MAEHLTAFQETPLITMSARPHLYSFNGLANHSIKLKAWLLAWLFIAMSGASQADQSQSNHLRFGVLPLQSPTKLAGMFLPLTDYLARVLGRPIQFVTSTNFSRYMDRVTSRDYDLIYLNPLLYSRSREHGYRVIAKVASEPFTGILVVHRDGPIKELSADTLPNGLRIGLPDPDAYAATVMTRQYLEDLGIYIDEQMQVEYFGSQDSALLALHSGLVDITGTWRPSLRSMPEQIQKDLRIIAETPPQPQMPIAVRDDLPEDEIERLRQALIDLPKTQEGQAIIEGLGFKKGFTFATDAEYLEVSK
ncbi:MAG: hypothetical protein C0631_16360 [Sedimenticola sp.]|nr:MAG: hypothetical protein C0631_16360 [Sedimenticola sp.]